MNVSLRKWLLVLLGLVPSRSKKPSVLNRKWIDVKSVFKKQFCAYWFCLSGFFNGLSIPANIPQAMSRTTATSSLPRDPVFPESMAKFLTNTGTEYVWS